MMSLIQTVSPERATGPVAETYAQIRATLQGVPNVFSIWSASPALLRQMWEQVGYYMQHPGLSFPLLAAIRMRVSQARQCDYCVDMNAGLLMSMAGWTPDQVAALREGGKAIPLSAREQAMLGFVLRAVDQPLEVSGQELDALRVLGWADGEILDALFHGARQVAGDIVFNALKIEKDF